MSIREEMHSVAQEIIHSHEDRGARIAQITLDVGGQLKALDSAHAAMSRELNAYLAQIAPALEETEAQRRQTTAGEIAQRRSDISAMLQGVRADLSQTVGGQLKALDSAHAAMSRELGGAREEWGKLTATMQAKRRGTTAVATPPMAGLEKRVFHYLANHPNGTRMTKLEQEFGTPRIQMARVLQSLMDENKARKQTLLYFAT